VVRAAVGLAAGYLRRSTDRFILRLEPDLPRVRGHTRLLEQALLNLLVNACQALPARSREIELSAAPGAAGESLVLRVADQGRGIPPEMLPRLKEMFFTTRREQGGSGLGLFIAATIVREHHGSLSLASEPGRGTVATLILPAELSP